MHRTLSSPPTFAKAMKYGLAPMSLGVLERVMFARRMAHASMKRVLGEPKMALYDMDAKLQRYLDFDGGVFIEAGANDGIFQSNTYYLEKRRGWTGLLIEPVPRYAAWCRRCRSATVVRCALGSADREGEELELLVGGLMTTPVDRGDRNGRDVRDLIAGARYGALEYGATPGQRITVGIVPLSSLIDRYLSRSVDFFSLDVEGFELQVLAGLDLARHRPRFILIESKDIGRVSSRLNDHYRQIDQLSHHDYLFGAHD